MKIQVKAVFLSIILANAVFAESPDDFKAAIIQKTRKLSAAAFGLSFTSPIGREFILLHQALLESGIEDAWDITFHQTITTDRDNKKLAESNRGLKNYLLDELLKDKSLQENALQFYRTLHTLDLESAQKREPLITDKSPYDLFSIAFDITHNPRNALLVLAVFGHNDQAEDLLVLNSDTLAIAKALNELKPKRNSWLYYPRSIGSVFTLDAENQAFTQSVLDFRRVAPEFQSSLLEARYYHMITAAFIAAELVYKKDDFRLGGILRFPEFVVREMGRQYKRRTIQETYLSNDAKKVWLSYKKRAPIPSEWPPARKERVRVEISFFEAMLKFSEGQYTLASSFGAQQIRDFNGQVK